MKDVTSENFGVKNLFLCNKFVKKFNITTRVVPRDM
jgi:hypothetical protein